MLALVAALNLPTEDVEILGLTTNYYPAKVRKRVAEAVLAAAGRGDIPVVAGSDYVMGTHRGTFLVGNEGEGLPDLSEEELTALFVAEDTDAAVDFIYDTCKRYPRRVVIVAIGMATNVGMCAAKYDDFDLFPAHIFTMSGGSVVTKKVLPRWSIQWDAEGNGAGQGGVKGATGDEQERDEKGRPRLKGRAVMGPFPLPATEEEGIAWSRGGRGGRGPEGKGGDKEGREGGEGGEGKEDSEGREDSKGGGGGGGGGGGDTDNTKGNGGGGDRADANSDDNHVVRPVILFPNHNVSGDTLGSCFMYNKCRRCPISVISHRITGQHYAEGGSIDTLRALGEEHKKMHRVAAAAAAGNDAGNDAGNEATKEAGGDASGEEGKDTAASAVVEAAIAPVLPSAAAADLPTADPPGALTGARVAGRFLCEWLDRRGMQKGQCPHDPLTLYEAVYPRLPAVEAEDAGGGGAGDLDEAGNAGGVEMGGEAGEAKMGEKMGEKKNHHHRTGFVPGRAALRYVSGTFVCHEWAGFLTFVPNPAGLHRMAVDVVDSKAWLGWLDDTLIQGIPLEKR